MILTMQEIIDANQICNILLKDNFPVRTSFKLIRLKKELTSAEENFNEIRNMIINKYSEKDENGELVTKVLENGQTIIPIQKEFREICTKEITEALKIEQDISDIFFDLEEFENITISPDDLLKIYQFIKE